MFHAVIPVVINLEGGLSLDPRDNGNWTGGKQGAGELRGTKYGISAAAYPTLDIQALTVDDAKAIYKRDYWDAVGGDELPPALAAVVFDTAVNSGVGTALRLLSESSSLLGFIGRRFQHYASLEQFNVYGRGWTRRFAEIVRLAGTLKPDGPHLAVFDDRNQEALTLPIPEGASVITRSAPPKYFVRIERKS